MHSSTNRKRWLSAGVAVLALLMLASPAPGQQSTAAATAVLERALDGPDPEARRAAFTALVDYRCRPGQVNDACLALLSAAAQHTDWIIRITALPFAVRTDLPAERCRPAIRNAAIRDPSEPVRRAAAKLLSDQAVGDDRDVFVTLLSGPDPLLREFASGGLARLGDRRQIDSLRADLRHRDPELALEAARLLSSIEAQRIADADAVFRVALAHDDEVVRANAVYTLTELQKPAWSEAEATRALDDPSPLVRSAALAALPAVQVTGAEPTWPYASLARRWDVEQTAELRVEILNAVGELGRRRVVPPSDVTRFAQFAVRHDPDHRLRVAAEGLLAEHDNEAAVRLVEMAGNPSVDLTDRLLALSSLGRSCQPAVLLPLGRFLDHPDGRSEEREALRVAAAAAWLRLAAALEDHRCDARTRSA